MKVLDRGAAPNPVCLGRFRHGRDSWSDLGLDDRAEIWRSLEAMQGSVCAYCEIAIGPAKRHIEHFRRKGLPQFVHLTFAWANLFGSCNTPDTCGKHKDKRGVDPDWQLLLDPAVDNPDDFLVFRTDGSVDARLHDGQPDPRGAETIRVFNLSAVSLVQRRRQVARDYLNTNQGLLEELESWSPEDRLEYAVGEVAAASMTAHSAVVRQLFFTV